MAYFWSSPFRRLRTDHPSNRSCNFTHLFKILTDHILWRTANSHVQFVCSNLLTCYCLLLEFSSYQSPATTAILQRSIISTQWKTSNLPLLCQYPTTPHTTWLASSLMRSRAIVFIILFIIDIVSPLHIFHTHDCLCVKDLRSFLHTISRRHTHSPFTVRNNGINQQCTHLILYWPVWMLYLHNPLSFVAYSRPRYTWSTTHYTNNNKRLPLFHYYHHLTYPTASHCPELTQRPLYTHVFTCLLKITAPFFFLSSIS